MTAKMSDNIATVRPSLRIALAVAAAVGLVAATARTHERAASLRGALPRESDTMYLPRTSVITVMSLGHRELAADLLYIRAINDYAAELFGRKNFDWFDRTLETVVALDPNFRAPYMFAARGELYSGLPITNDAVWRANRFLERGVERFPRDWELAFTLGCNYIDELQTDDKAQKKRWKATGGEWIRRAALVGGGPTWLPNLAATIMTEQGQLDAAIRYLEEAYLTTENEASRQEIANLLGAKRAKNLAAIEKARDDFVAAWKKTMPYAPGDLFVLVGEPPSPRLDPAFVVRDPVLDGATPAPSTPPTPQATP